jgi:hypothetical protein
MVASITRIQSPLNFINIKNSVFVKFVTALHVSAYSAFIRFFVTSAQLISTATG